MAPKLRVNKNKVINKTRGPLARNQRRQPGRRIPRSIDRMPNQPPQHKYTAVAVFTTARLRFDKSIVINKIDSNEIDIYTLISKTLWNNVIKAFDEIKYTKISVWLDTNLSPMVGGRIGLALIPDHTNIGEKDFLTAMELPNAMVRRPGQTLHTHWFPSEPSEREWFSTIPSDTDAATKKITLVAGSDMLAKSNNVKDEKYSVQFTIDVTFKLRGLTGIATNGPSSSYRMTLPSRDGATQLCDDFQMI